MKKLLEKFTGNIVALALQDISTFAADYVLQDSDGVPIAWRLFAYGPFTITKNGVTFAGTFDEEHADSIIAYFNQKGVKIPLDSEHYIYRLAEKLKVSEAEIVAVLQDKRAAMAFGRLEKREDGLWIADVEWSDLAHQLMAEHIFQFFSPVVRGLSTGALRITSVAMTNTPAIDQLEAIAASAEAAVDAQQEWATLALSDLNRAIKPAGKGEQHMNKLLALVGAVIGLDAIALSEDGTVPADVLTKLEQLGKELPTLRGSAAIAAKALDVLELSADTDAATLEGSLRALVAKAGQADELGKRVDALELSAETDKKTKLVEKGRAAGKLTQAMIDGWVKEADTVALAAFLETAPVYVQPGRIVKGGDLPQDDVVALTDEDRKVCKQLGIDEATFLETKKAERTAA